MSAKRDAEIMMLCVRLMDKVQHEYYGREYQDYYKSDMRFIPSESHPGSYEMEVEILEENFDDYFKKYPLTYRMVPNLQAPKEEIAYHIAKINEERAHKLLFKLLEQNIRRWWD
jgi:cell fate regulator YaaT (PSP1 superfamily)